MCTPSCKLRWPPSLLERKNNSKANCFCYSILMSTLTLITEKETEQGVSKSSDADETRQLLRSWKSAPFF